MSSVGVGVVVGGVVGVALGAGAAVTLLRRGGRADLKRADRFARRQDLWLPPEFARSARARLRRREGLTQVLAALVGAPLFSWNVTELLDHIDAPMSPGQIVFLPGPFFTALFVLPLGLINVAVHLWDVSWTGRRAATHRPSRPPPRAGCTSCRRG
jgi:hypothetical protein